MINNTKDNLGKLGYYPVSIGEVLGFFGES